MPAEPIRWSRLEPRTRDESLAPGLEARVADPLWLLGRQWQFGELSAGQELGSAVLAELVTEVAPIDGYRPGRPADGLAGEPYDPGAGPLEARVEGEAQGLLTGRARARAGLQFERMLVAAGLGRYAAAYRAAYPLEPPDEAADTTTMRFFAVVAGRVPDGARLYEALSSASPELPVVEAADGADMAAQTQAWLEWCDSFTARQPGGPAWVADRMEYAFGLEAAGVALEAEEHTDGRVDWYAFSAAGDGASAENGGPPVTTIPAPVTYPGMPARRLWEFEDANVSFGDVQAHPEDLGRLLLTEFALVFGGDWLLLPVEVPAGSLVRVSSLLVHDTFGQRVRIAPAAGDDGWQMFRLSPGGDPDLLVPPALMSTLRGRDLEEVLLLRDEGANLAWAVERTVEGEHGLPVDRAQAAYARTPEPEPPRAEGEAFTYRLMSEVPDHWLPLLPRREQPGEPAVELVVGVVDAPPHGRVLSPGAVLREEEVPREGARVTRGYQLARWVDGSTHLWLGRRKRVGRGEGSSGLRFDAME